MDGTQNFYFPICALLISLLILITFFCSKRLRSNETEIYVKLIIVNTLESFVACLIVLTALTINSYKLLEILDKIDYILILTWIWLLFSYSFTLISNKKFILKLTLFINIIISILMIFTEVIVINSNGIMNSTGISNYILTFAVAFYIILLVICVIIGVFKTNNDLKKYIPMSALVIFIIGMFIIRVIRPEIVLLSFIISFVDLIMHNTIENPDLQMLKEFHKAKEQAEESNREKTNFLFNISNEIKKPINNIIYTSENAINKQEISDIKNDLRAIKGDSNNLLSYVNNVLDISDEEIRQIEIKGSKYNSKRLFEIISKKYEPTLNKIEYRFKYDNSTPEYLYGDSMRIKQIVNILLENAREYTKQGYIELSVNSIVKNEICRLVITVEDSGTGMDTETIKHLFDKDKIYDDKLLKEIDDTKNNLSILKSIVNLMNGSVLVESTIGSGSKFTVILDQKISTEKTKIEEKVEEYEKMYEKDKKIILVTDNKEISTKIQKILKKQPYKLEIVTLGQTCLEQIRSGTEYDLIIIDEEIPKLNYEDTLNKIKETKCYKKPVLLITSNQIFGSKEMYQEKGFKDTIYKPIKKEELIHEIEEYINE